MATSTTYYNPKLFWKFQQSWMRWNETLYTKNVHVIEFFDNRPYLFRINSNQNAIISECFFFHSSFLSQTFCISTLSYFPQHGYQRLHFDFYISKVNSWSYYIAMKPLRIPNLSWKRMYTERTESKNKAPFSHNTKLLNVYERVYSLFYGSIHWNDYLQSSKFVQPWSM